MICPAIERICGCGSVLQEFDVETSEQLDIIPAKVQVIRHVRPKYACAHCHVGVKIAPVTINAHLPLLNLPVCRAPYRRLQVAPQRASRGLVN